MTKSTLIDISRIYQFGAALCAALIIAGCASGPAYRAETAPAADRALVYIYTSQAMPLWMRTAAIAINGKSIGNLPNGSYLSVELPVGEYEIVQSWSNWLGDYSAMTRPRTMKLVAKPGGVHFVEFALLQRSQYPYIITNWNISEVPSTQGAEAIQQCKRQSAQ